MRTDTASIVVHASAARVYQAFADPDALQRWLPPEGMTGEMIAFDFREGGSYHMRLTYNDPQHAHGKSRADADDVAVRFGTLVPDRCIEEIVTFDSEDPAFAGEMRITWTFEPVDEGTRVSVRCVDVPEGISAADHDAGLQSTLRNLAQFTEADG